jgi:hypothetical protein
MSSFAELVDEFREWLKSDPKSAAKQLGTYPRFVNQWIAGTARPPLVHVEKYHNDIKPKNTVPEAPVIPVDAPVQQQQVVMQPVQVPRPQSQSVEIYDGKMAPVSLANPFGLSKQKLRNINPKEHVFIQNKPISTSAPVDWIDPLPVPAPVQTVQRQPVIETPVRVERKTNDELLLSLLRSYENRIQDIPYEAIRLMGNIFFPWEGKKITVAFPCYKWTNAATAWALLAVGLDVSKEKIGFDMELGDAQIHHGRDKLANRFVDSGREWLLFIDDDVIPPVGRASWFRNMGRVTERQFPDKIAGRHVINRLIGHGKTLVGGTYFGRQPGGMPMCAQMHNPQVVQKARNMSDEIISMDWVATGCMLIHRNVFLDIQKKFPELAPSKELGRDYWNYFNPGISGGEDKDFCFRARAAGHEVFLDTGCQCLHVGFCAYHALNT